MKEEATPKKRVSDLYRLWRWQTEKPPTILNSYRYNNVLLNRFRKKEKRNNNIVYTWMKDIWTSLAMHLICTLNQLMCTRFTSRPTREHITIALETNENDLLVVERFTPAIAPGFKQFKMNRQFFFVHSFPVHQTHHIFAAIIINICEIVIAFICFARAYSHYFLNCELWVTKIAFTSKEKRNKLTIYIACIILITYYYGIERVARSI